ncbi:MAG: BACON domain-containing protein [Prevotellaceae bacterium]|jgi:hypothetical protein|nr:BACON domain-containing protein [Prevotellaceae bacterium]
MNKTVFLIAATGMATLFVSCSKQVILNVSTETINVGANPTTETFEIMSDAMWDIVVIEPWLTVSPLQGEGTDVITVDIDENVTEEARSAIIGISAGDNIITKDVIVHQEERLNLPEKATISGKNSNCPEGGALNIVLTAEADNASSFVWYHGLNVIPEATGATYVATAQGDYYVAGVNEDGEGEKSDPKSLFFYEDCGVFVDELVGTWSVVEGIYASEDSWEYPKFSSILITKIDAGTISISGIWSQMFSMWNGFSITATVNLPDETITVTGTKIADGLLESGLDTYFVPKVAEKGVNVTTLTQTYPVKRVNGTLVITPLEDYDDPNKNLSFAIASTNAGSTDNGGWVYLAYRTEWTKKVDKSNTIPTFVDQRPSTKTVSHGNVSLYKAKDAAKVKMR